MRVAVISDIHGNRPAFEAVLEAVAAERPDTVWCLGDLVGYGAEPDACLALAREHVDLCLAGNHDLAVCGDLPLAEFSQVAAIAAAWTQSVVDSDHLAWLAGLAPQDGSRPVGLYHASPRDPVWEYVLAAEDADACMSVQQQRICLIGHSHIALSFERHDGGPVAGDVRTDGEELDLSTGSWLLNPGSVGQPRDSDPRAAWLLLDVGAWRASYRRTAYDVGAAAAAIEGAGLPAILARRLFGGQ